MGQRQGDWQQLCLIGKTEFLCYFYKVLWNFKGGMKHTNKMPAAAGVSGFSDKIREIG